MVPGAGHPAGPLLASGRGPYPRGMREPQTFPRQPVPPELVELAKRAGGYTAVLGQDPSWTEDHLLLMNCVFGDMGQWPLENAAHLAWGDGYAERYDYRKMWREVIVALEAGAKLNDAAGPRS